MTCSIFSSNGVLHNVAASWLYLADGPLPKKCGNALLPQCNLDWTIIAETD